MRWQSSSVHAIVVDVLGGPEQLQWHEVPDPVPGPGQVAVKVGLTSVGFADTQARRGVGAALAGTAVRGLDAMGTIVALGDGVTDRHVGQRVACNPFGGSYAEIVVVGATLTYPMDAGISDEAAASGTVLVTAYNILTLAGRLQRGERARPLGGGRRRLGRRADGEAPRCGPHLRHRRRPEKLALCTEKPVQISVAIDYRRDDFAAIVKAQTGGAGVDLILDAIGGGVFEAGFPVLAPFGRYVIYGQASDATATARVDGLHRTNRAILGYSSGRYAARSALNAAVSAAYDLVRSGSIRILEGGRFPLRDAAAAHRLVESRTTTGRVFLTL